MIAQFMPLIIKAVLPKAADHIAKVFKLKELRQEVKELRQKVEDLKKDKMDSNLRLDALTKYMVDMQDEK